MSVIGPFESVQDEPSGPPLPARLARLNELARNLWWSWHPEARSLFEALDKPLWKMTQHNPVRVLREIAPERLGALEQEAAFLRLYDAVLAAFDADQGRVEGWATREVPELADQLIAYFSAEFGLHNSLPIYSGGLGILAGDHCKEASDLGLHLVGVGFLYQQGYFHQQIQATGWQEEAYRPIDPTAIPIRPARTRADRCVVTLPLGDRSIAIAVWRVDVGRARLYLMDTDIPENEPWDRELSARLYGGDRELRIRQEIVLGIGGVRVLRALGHRPAVWHLNEGHTTFVALERIREMVAAGATFEEASGRVRATTIFTTHTPVLAGHDAFPFHLVERYFSGYWSHLGLTREQFLALGRLEEAGRDSFNMTVLALRAAGYANAVSERNGRVTRRMWRSLWPDRPEEQVPIISITNGVHVASWIALEMSRLYEKYVAPDWIHRHDDPEIWKKVLDIPDEVLWETHQQLKRRLLGQIRERARARWTEDRVAPDQVLAAGTLLDPEALTIGFARRFTAYKRATLLFRDLDRLCRLLRDRWRPVQIIFSGKAHPADEEGKRQIHQIYTLARDPSLSGHIAFVNNYELHLAHFVVQGMDLWLNNPRPPMEASGTSGQKASLNGIPQLSTLDGWWAEGYNGANGWAFGPNPDSVSPPDSPEAADAADAEALYRLLEEQVIPLFYDRDADGIPRGWVRLMKETIRSNVPRFCARRMVKEYALKLYRPAAQAAGEQTP